jgi:hypothetical protein
MRVSAITGARSAASWATWTTMIFIVLNMTDAWLTKQLLAHDGVEMFWWSAHFNSNIVAKSLLALVIALVLMRLGKARLLKWLVIGMVMVVLSNGICYAGYFGSWLYWQTQIATYP